jgi:hypothetical protein
MIPLTLLERTIDLLEQWNISDYGPHLFHDYQNVLWALKVKIQKIELRDAYARIIAADNEDDRDEARMQYLLKKHLLRENQGDPF